MDNRNFIAKRAAAYFQPGDVVNLGIGIPSLCGSYAVDGVLFQSENGFIGIGPTVQEGLMKNERFVNAGGVPFVPVPGSSAFDVAMSFMHQSQSILSSFSLLSHRVHCIFH